MNTIPKPPLTKVFLGQALTALSIAAAIAIDDRVRGYSFMIGCLIHFVGSLYFAWQGYRFRGARQTRSMVQAMYRGEAGKIVLSGALFATVFAIVRPISAAFVFVGFLVMQAVHVALLARLLR